MISEKNKILSLLLLVAYLSLTGTIAFHHHNYSLGSSQTSFGYSEKEPIEMGHPTLNGYHFCQIFYASEQGSVFFSYELILGLSKDIGEILASVRFHTVNKPVATLSLLRAPPKIS